MDSPGSGSDSVIRFERVTVRFEDVTALDEVSFEVLAGDSLVILGAAGSGKTVLLKTAIGLVCADSGRVFLFGQDITRLPEQELFDIRSRAGMLFQEGALFDSANIEENVAYPLLNIRSIRCREEDVHPRVVEALRFVELEETLEKFPSELSGGMRRRAAIARAVVTAPPLVLYDSPTAGLDPITAHTIMALVIKEREVSHTTTLIVTHRYQDANLLANFRYNSEQARLDPVRQPGAAALRTRFIVLREGRLIFQGDQDELEASRDPYVSKFFKHRN